MNTSLPAVQISSDKTGAMPGAVVNLSGKQQDSAPSSGFGPLLNQAQTALATDVDGNGTLPDDAEGLALQLQSLPQGGRLLPLLPQLQQVLDNATAKGADSQQVLDDIVARVQALLEGDETDPMAAMATMLNQMLGPATPVLPVSTAETISLVTTQGGSAKTAGAMPPGLREIQPLIDPTATGDKLISGDSPADSKNTPFDRSLAQLQQPVSEPRQSELSMLMAAFKRQLDSPGKPTDAMPRAEALGASVSAPVTSPPAAVVPPTGQPMLGVTTPLNQAGWDQALGERIQWLASQNIQGARISLNPANLGPMEVRIQIQNDQASIQFTSAHGVVREALEAALPRLRDMFEASGVELVDVDVAGQSFAEQQRGADGEDSRAARAGAGNGHESGGDSAPELVAETPLASFLPQGRLDLFV
ncbi:MAG: hypothetical protein GWP13_00650 [Planctomycetia bacterium]|nr:hypothetical protein [Planctomycetia bacterium]